MRLETARGLTRRLLALVVGSRGEHAVHALYHRFLRRVRLFGIPESRAIIRVLATLAAKANTILDVGANAGRYTWFFAQHATHRTTVYAFEPLRGAFALLCATATGLPGVVCIPLGLGESEEKVTLRIPLDGLGNPTTGLAWVGPAEPGQAEVLTDVMLTSVDQLVRTGFVRMRPPALMKIDVEGFEYNVLLGARETLRRFNPVIYFECQNWALERIGVSAGSMWATLKGAGYAIAAERNGAFEVLDGIDESIVSYFAVPAWNAAAEPTRLTGDQFVDRLSRAMGA